MAWWRRAGAAQALVVLPIPGSVTGWRRFGPARDHLGDVLAGELGELVAAAGLAAEEQADDERAVLLEEEDVARLLLVHVATEHAERRLVEAGLRGPAAGRRRRAAPGGGLFHEPGDVVVEEGERLLDLGAHRVGPRAAGRAGGHEALDDEAVGRLHEQDVLHPALVEERADRAEDLLEVLARAALVDPHAQPSSSGSGGLVQQPAILGAALAHAEDPGGGECNQRPGRQQGDDDRRGVGRGRAGQARPQAVRARRPTTGRPGRPRAGRPRSTRSAASAGPTAWTACGRTDSGKTDAAHEEQGAGHRLRVRPRLLAGLEADRGEQDADGDDRAQAEDHRRRRAAASRRRRVERDAEAAGCRRRS